MSDQDTPNPSDFLRKKPPTILKERMLKIARTNWTTLTVRLWVPDNGEPDTAFTELAAAVSHMLNGYKTWTQSSLAKEIIEKFTVNAVEVVDFGGQGVVLYDSWP